MWSEKSKRVPQSPPRRTCAHAGQSGWLRDCAAVCARLRNLYCAVRVAAPSLGAESRSSTAEHGGAPREEEELEAEAAEGGCGVAAGLERGDEEGDCPGEEGERPAADAGELAGGHGGRGVGVAAGGGAADGVALIMASLVAPLPSSSPAAGARASAGAGSAACCACSASIRRSARLRVRATYALRDMISNSREALSRRAAASARRLGSSRWLSRRSHHRPPARL